MSDTEPQEMTTLIESMPSVGWVVHEVVLGREGEGTVWAWCRVEIDAPRYVEIVFTRADGQTAVDDPTIAASHANPRSLRLGPVLFKLWC